MRASLLLLVAMVAFAQTTIIVSPTGAVGTPNVPVVQREPSKPEDLCTLEGQVSNAVTGAALRKATVLMRRVDVVPGAGAAADTYTTTSDAAGKYAMKDLEPGRYMMTVQRNGFVTASYGARGPQRPGATLTLDRARKMTGVDFRLTPHSVVAGQILDEDGEPVPNVQVQLLRYQYIQGRRQLTMAGGGSTNDLGEYRVFGVAPGKYYLSASARQTVAAAGQVLDRSAAAQSEEDFVPTYYPGTADSAGATPIETTPGAVVSGINLVLSKAHTVHVKGHVTNSVVATRQPIRIYLLPRTAMLGLNVRSYAADPSGAFDIRGVAPGAYSLTAVVNEDSKSYTARLPVTVGSSNLENLKIAIGPGATINGAVRIAGEKKNDLSNVYVRLQPREAGGIFFGGMASGRVKADNSFTLENAGADLFNVMVTGLPDGYYVKSIHAGETDVLAGGLDTSLGAPAPLDIVVSPNAGAVGGTVQNAKTGQPAPGATVVLVPQERERAGEATYFRTITADQNGSYSLRNLPPGEYKAYAWEDIEPGAYMDPDFMKGFEGKGESVSVGESEKKTVALNLIPAAAQ